MSLITLILSIIGTAGTVYTIISTIFFQRKKLRIAIHSLHVNESFCTMFVSIENLSRLPIAISSVSVCLYDNVYPCHVDSVKVAEVTTRSGNVVNNVRPYYSMSLPISLSSLAGISGYLHFDNIPGKLLRSSTELTVQVATNRGSAMRMKLDIHHLESNSLFPR